MQVGPTTTLECFAESERNIADSQSISFGFRRYEIAAATISSRVSFTRLPVISSIATVQIKLWPANVVPSLPKPRRHQLASHGTIATRAIHFAAS